ncbi:MAG: cyclic nucleotide-binding domain-containing protein [Anaerolineales bacterium]|nr:cyclic nucleotide-binding domain-containing protein [Anaerolineales bacterium]
MQHWLRKDQSMSKKINLREVILFSRLTDEALADVSAALKPRQLEPGEILFNQGDPGDELIIVEKGMVAIFVPVEGQPGGGQPIRIFTAGEMLGEMAPIDRKPRSLSARAEGQARILALHGDDFHRIMSRNPEMAISVMAGLSDRIRYTTDFLGEVRGWVKRIAEGDYGSRAVMESSKYEDRTLASLAAEFAQMAVRVQEREETLRQEVAQLRIEIDEAKRKQEAKRIMDSDYYKSLKEKAQQLRRRDE